MKTSFIDLYKFLAAHNRSVDPETLEIYRWGVVE